MKPGWNFGDYWTAFLVAINAVGTVLYAVGVWEPDRFSTTLLSLVATTFFVAMFTERRQRAWRDLRAEQVRRLLREAGL